MITATQFCKTHSSFWRDVAPTMDLFVRRINLGQYERDFPEMKAVTRPTRRGFINEISFSLFCENLRRGLRWPANDPTSNEIHHAVELVRSSAVDRGIDDYRRLGEPNLSEIADISEQVNRLMRNFTIGYPMGDVIAEPIFRGCGIIDTSKGDLLASSTLFEIKAGDRLFRSIDVRQLIIYAALNHVAKEFKVDKVGLFNPRVGIRIELDLDEVCIEISGKKSVDLLMEIALVISSGQVSR